MMSPSVATRSGKARAAPPWKTRLVLSHVLVILVLISLELIPLARGAVSCNASSPEICSQLLWEGSECRDGYCTNPFERGCLQTLLMDEAYYQLYQEGGEKFSADNHKLQALVRRLRSSGLRACNSEDPTGSAEKGLCFLPGVSTSNDNNNQVDDVLYSYYNEIRIASQNWESAFFASWIMQIVLSEILLVPTTIETGKATAKLNFYDPTNVFQYGAANSWEGIDVAFRENGDCTAVTESNVGADEDKYVPCTHVIPEIWHAHTTKDGTDRQKSGIIEAPEGIGAIGDQSWFVTKFTAQQDPTLIGLHGLQGQENRRKLAETFKRPTTWADYCKLVSPDGCATPDGVAERAPKDEAEDARMHVPGLYTGHFRATDKNDCDKNPFTCTGHIADYPCGWTSFVKAQTYHHNIALESDGSEKGSSGYSYNQMSEMWLAANATNSNLMSLWWAPEALHSKLMGTKAEMQRVSLTWPTQECIENRLAPSTRCNFKTEAEQYGHPLGACDDNAASLVKVIAGNLYSTTHNNDIPKALRSPAYDVVKDFTWTELEMAEVLSAWLERGQDQWNFDPRLATCSWVAENLDKVQRFIPRSYPRVALEQGVRSLPLFYAAVTASAIATALTLVAIGVSYSQRNRRVMRYAQIEFVLLLLAGLFMVSIGSLLLALEPNNASCTATQWLITMGYTTELVPLLVKVAAIIRCANAAKKMRRVVLSKQKLFETVIGVSVIVVVFCTTWTIVDKPKRNSELKLTEEVTDLGETIVEVSYYCSSESRAWYYASASWQCLLLFCATVLAFQMRSVECKALNDSQTLVVMIYSSFMFVVLRILTYLLSDPLPEALLARARSLIFSTDTIVNICVYFVPKFLTKEDEGQRISVFLGTASNASREDGPQASVAPFGTPIRQSQPDGGSGFLATTLNASNAPIDSSHKILPRGLCTYCGRTCGCHEEKPTEELKA